MAARGWSGAPPRAAARPLTRADAAFLAALAGLPLVARIALEVVA